MTSEQDLPKTLPISASIATGIHIDPEKHQLYSPSYGQFKEKAAELLVGEAGSVGDQVPRGEAQQIQDRVRLLSHLFRILPAPQVRLTRPRQSTYMRQEGESKLIPVVISLLCNGGLSNALSYRC
jgi:hypothetical protein